MDMYSNLFLAKSLLTGWKLRLRFFIRPIIILFIFRVCVLIFVIHLCCSQAYYSNLLSTFLGLLFLLSLLALNSLPLWTLKRRCDSLCLIILINFNYCEFVLQFAWATIRRNYLVLNYMIIYFFNRSVMNSLLVCQLYLLVYLLILLLL